MGARRRSPAAAAGRLPLLFLVVLLVLTACTGDAGSGITDGATDPSPGATEELEEAAPDHAGFTERAEAICGAAAEELGPLGSRQAVANLSEEAVVRFRIAVPIYRVLVAGLRQLDPPSGEEAQVEGLIGAFERVADKGDELLAAGRAGNESDWSIKVGEFFSLLDRAIDENYELGVDCP